MNYSSNRSPTKLIVLAGVFLWRKWTSKRWDNRQLQRLVLDATMDAGTNEMLLTKFLNLYHNNFYDRAFNECNRSVLSQPAPDDGEYKWIDCCRLGNVCVCICLFVCEGEEGGRETELWVRLRETMRKRERGREIEAGIERLRMRDWWWGECLKVRKTES